MSRIKTSFGKIKDGTETFLYTIRNEKQMSATITDFGATLVSLWVPDKYGKLADVVLGYDYPISYEENSGCLGATIGRNSNRIKDAKLSIEGIEYRLDANNNGNNLHSGFNPYHKRMWEVSLLEEDRITLTCNSPHMDQGYPGNFVANVTYEITKDNELSITYKGTTDKTTIFNMTNHSYFNLAGHNSGVVLNQELWLDAQGFTITDNKLIPTGEIVSVENTPMDFNLKKTLLKDIDADYEPLKIAGGYDHNWVLNTKGQLKEIAYLEERKSGRRMRLFTDSPGVQIYTGNSIVEGIQGKGGAVYGKYHGVCLETQYFPDAVHHANFSQPILKAEETKQYRTIYQFETIE